MQSGLGKSDKWLIEFETEDTGINPLMGWETNSNTCLLYTSPSPRD